MFLQFRSVEPDDLQIDAFGAGVERSIENNLGRAVKKASVRHRHVNVGRCLIDLTKRVRYGMIGTRSPSLVEVARLMGEYGRDGIV